MLKNKVVLVTAGAQGIGRACAEFAAKQGAKVYIADWDKELSNKTVQEFVAEGFQAEALFFNALEKQSYKDMVEHIIKNENKIDILINNFGGVNPAEDKDFLNTDVDKWGKNVLTNINSVFLASQNVLPYMIKNRTGSIVNISSLSSLIPDITSVAYGTAKHAINHMTKQIAIQYARFGIRCNAVLPGLISTHAVEANLTKEFISDFLKIQPIPRVGVPNDIAYAAVFLASDYASLITGILLPVDGGMDLTSARYPNDIQKSGLSPE
ncbi:MAG: SDR family NAD(P)-dependent oxidoreductase [Brevinemataceae bacterium]